MTLNLQNAIKHSFSYLERKLNIRPHQFLFDETFTKIPGNIPLFITIYTQGPQKNLRGCIGTFAPNNKTFAETIERYTKSAAFGDSRFAPLSQQEFLTSDVSISINVLHTFETASAWDDWEIGKHGTTLHFEDKYGKNQHSTFLPSVAVSHNFTKTQVIEQLRKKAGGNAKYSGQEFYHNLKIERYQSSEMCMSYTDYLKSLPN